MSESIAAAVFAHVDRSAVADAVAAGPTRVPAARTTGFTLSAGGRFEPLAHSTVSLPDDVQPCDVRLNWHWHQLGGDACVGSSQIDNFRVCFDGLLIPAAGSLLAAQAAGPFGSEFRPTNTSRLFVSKAHRGSGNGTVSACRVAAGATFSSIGSSRSPTARQRRVGRRAAADAAQHRAGGEHPGARCGSCARIRRRITRRLDGR